MANKPTRVMVIGIDSTIVPRLYRWAKAGKLPVLQGLMERGVFCPNTLVPFPTITPPNWTSIATGAWPMTHGITDYDVFIPGRELDDCHNGYNSDEVLAQPIWNALEEAGKRCIVANYPTTWPTTLKHGYQIGGCGLGLTDWRVGLPIPAGNYSSLTLDFLITTELYPFADEVAFRRASGWSGVPLSPAALEAEVSLTLRRTRWKMAPVTFHIALDKSAGSSAYDTVIVAKAKSPDGVYCTLQPGVWSGNLYDSFQTEDGAKQAVFRFKVLELSPDGHTFRMYCPGLNALEGWGFPPGMEAEFVRECRGLPTGKTGWEALVYEWIDRQTLAEITMFAHEFLADASHWLLTHKPWDFYITHIHPVDWIYHAWGRELDPLTAEDQGQIAAWTELEYEIYRQSDWAVGRLLEAADEHTLVVVVSDHGAKAAGARFKVNDLLAKAGLLAYADAGPAGSPARETTLGA
jgi:hypothetical protein